MPNGYETRTGARPSFASATQTPKQSRSSLTGASAGAQVVGGESQSGGFGGNFTTPGPSGEGLGEFFGQIMEPYVQRRMQDAVLKGYIDSSTRKAGQEIKASNGGFSKIFGPTAYEEGAVMYTAAKAGKELASGLLEEGDTLRQMTPDDLQKVVSERMRSKLTGNAYADHMLMTNMLESAQPVIETISKRRAVWQQDNAINAAAGASKAGADLFQSLAESNATLSHASDGDTATLSYAKDAYLSSLQKPIGMTEDSYKSFLHGTLMTAMQDGNFHAVEALRKAGIDHIFDDDERVKLENAYDRYADDKVAAVLMRPDMQQQYIALLSDEADPKPGVLPTDIVERKIAFNNLLTRVSGVDVDLFDHKALASGAVGMVSALASERRRQEDHRWQVEGQEREITARRQDEELRDKLKVSKVTAYFLAGKTAEGLLSGAGEADDYETLGNNAYRSGNYDLLQSNFTNGTTFKKVQGDMQLNLRVAIGGQYGKSVDRAHQDWQQLRRRSPALAMAYFGDFDGPMRAYHEAVASDIPPSIAFQRSFQDPARYGPSAIPSGRAKEAATGMAAAMNDHKAWTVMRPLTGKPTNLNASSQRALRGYIEGRLGSLMQNSREDAGRLSRDILSSGRSTGAVERYGQFVIINPSGTRSLSDMLHLQNDEATTAIVGLIDKRMKGAGFSSGAGADEYEIVRYVGEKGQPVLNVMASDDSGHHSIVIHFADLQAAARQRVQQKKTATGNSLMGLDPYRHIPGETPAARVTRTNREINWRR